MSATYAVHFLRKPTDPNHQRKLRALEALAEADVEMLPKELAEYFGMERVDQFQSENDFLSHGFELVSNYGGTTKTNTPGVTRGRDDHRILLIIDVAELPEDVKIIHVALS